MENIKLFCLIVAVAMMTLTACGNNKSQTENKANASADNGAETTARELEGYGKITISDYKMLPLTVEEITVTDEEVQASLDSLLEQNKEYESITTGTVETGDTAVIDYVGKIDGVAFDGGTGSYDLVIGSGAFIPGFEDGCIGMKVGETKDIDVTFPDPYTSEDLAGKAAVFTVTLNEIKRAKAITLDDAWVAANYTEVSTVEELRELTKNDLLESKKVKDIQTKGAEALDMVVENSSFDIPQEKIEEERDKQKESYEQFVQYYMGVDLETYLTNMGMTDEDFDEVLDTTSVKTIKQEMITNVIFEKENLEITDDVYEMVATTYGGDIETVKASFTDEDGIKSLRYYAILSYLYNNAEKTNE